MYLKLNPRKAKDLLPDVSKETGLPLELLEDLSDFYWNDLHKIVTGINHYHVFVPNLGCFHVKGNQTLEPEIATLEKILAYYKEPPRSPYKWAIWDSRCKKLEKLKTLLKQYYDELQARRDNRELRKQIRNAKENLEQPQANP